MATVIRWTPEHDGTAAGGGHPSGRAADDAVPLPVKPTAAMLAEGASAGGVNVETVWRIYRAMLRAAGD